MAETREKLRLEHISVEEYNKKVAQNTLNNLTIYWLNNGTIYTRGKLFGGKIQTITSTDPEYPEMNTIYVDPKTLSFKIWNGINYDYISKGYTTNVSDDSDDDLLPTAKAVANYIQNKFGSMPQSIGVSDITASDGGTLNITKDEETTPLQLLGVVNNPSYDTAKRKITLPVNGKKQLEINLGKDMVVTAGKYNNDTSEIWLTRAEDKSYTNDEDVIKIPASELVDVYTGTETNSSSVTVSQDNEISVDVKLSRETGNSLVIKTDGLYVNSDNNNKLDKVAASHVNEIITANADGTVKVSGKNFGGNTFKVEPDSNTIATEKASKSYADNVANNALTASNIYSDNIGQTVLAAAKDYSDSLITWVDW